MLFPTLAAEATPAERAAFERRAQLARFFGGTPRQGGSAAAAAEPMPSAPQSSLHRLQPRAGRRPCGGGKQGRVLMSKATG